MKKYGRKHIGSTYRTNEGYSLKVIDGGSKPNYVTVQIEDWITEKTMGNIKKGNVKYPFHPSVCGIGFYGTEEILDKFAYQKWVDMLKRCYDSKTQVEHPSYIGCSVDIEWHNFSTFAKWIKKYYPRGGNRYDLDKDIRVQGNKIYSSSNCILVPTYLNSFMTNGRSTNTSGYVGVSWHKKNERWIARINLDKKAIILGGFKCIRTASRAYVEARAIEAKRLRDYYSFDYPKDIIKNIV